MSERMDGGLNEGSGECNVGQNFIEEVREDFPLDDILRETISSATLEIESAIDSFNALGLSGEVDMDAIIESSSGDLDRIFQQFRINLPILIQEGADFPALKSFLIEKREDIGKIITLLKDLYEGNGFDELAMSWDTFVVELPEEELTV